MFKKTLTAALIVAISSTTAQAGMGERLLNLFENDKKWKASAHKAKAYSQVRPPSSFKGQWYTTDDGCSYSRANPPGGVSWHLILNPHHIGQPNAHLGCAPML